MYRRFDEFHSKWLEKAQKEDVNHCVDWLDGRIYEKSDAVQNETAKTDVSNTKESSNSNNNTRKIIIDDENKKPFRRYCKYKVESAKS